MKRKELAPEQALFYYISNQLIVNYIYWTDLIVADF